LLSEAVYNVTKLPVRVELGDVGLVCAVALVLCILFSLLPALRAALMRPVQALRYE
jgi:lipoprotein-releasing system permease protein